jgi:ATP-dependent DNA helicase RecG
LLFCSQEAPPPHIFNTLRCKMCGGGLEEDAMTLQDEVAAIVAAARVAGTDSASVEIKKAAGGAPKTLPHTVSAFANGAGGMIILGLDETAGFTPAKVNAAALADALASACADNVTPPVRARIEVVSVGGHPVAVAVVPPADTTMRPCYVRAQGMENGSYIREHDGDRHLSSYEIHLLISDRGQPRDDSMIVPGAHLSDLDPTEVSRLITRFRARRGPGFASFADGDILRMAGVIPWAGGDQVTLCGLLALGVYPQAFYPQLNVTFVSFPTLDGGQMRDGTRFLDNVAIDGSIPAMVSGLLAAVMRNMRRGAAIIGAGREDIWEYPVEAVRELVVNAIMHRDYHPMSHGAQIRVEMYPDRLAFVNPGGLYGAASTDELLAGTISFSRNAVLAKLLEDVEIPPTSRAVCENRGSGIKAIIAELAAARMPPLQLTATGGWFTAQLRHHQPESQPAPPGVPTDQATARAAPSAILAALSAGPHSTPELMGLTGLTRPTLGNRLRALEAAGLVSPTTSRRSRNVKWQLTR